MRGKDMHNDRHWSWLPKLLIVTVVWISGCSTGGDTAREDPWESPDISGVWLGYLDSNAMPPVFSIGIITDGDDGYISRFIADDRQYVNPVQALGVAPFTLTPNTAVMSGDLAEYSWTGMGDDYGTSTRTLYLIGSASEKGVLGLGWPGGAFTYTQEGSNDETGVYVFIYNSTFDVSPRVQNLGGTWVVRDAWRAGNTLRLTITPDPLVTNTTSAVISGSDTIGNTFSGSVTIRYSPVPHNIYDVNLRMNNAINLEGLATYILEMSDEDSGIVIPRKTLAIGASSNDYTHSVGGLATPD